MSCENYKCDINKLLEKDCNNRISTADESFSEYFNDNDMNNDAFVFSRDKVSKSTRRPSKTQKLKDIKELLEKLKVNK